MVFQPPSDADVPKTVCLHLKVMCEFMHQEKLVGEVFVPNLHPYVLAGMVRAQPETFTIWAPNRTAAAGAAGARAPPGMPPGAIPGGPPGVPGAAGSAGPLVRPSVGQLVMGITWVPGDRPEIGQLCLAVHHIKFEATRLDQPP